MPTVDSCISNVFRDLNFSDTTVTTETRSYALGINGTPYTGAFDSEAYAGFTAYGYAGIKPYSYSLRGSWPTGLSIDSSTGIVSGTPTGIGAYASLSVRVTDAYNVTADLTPFTLTIYNELRLDLSHDYDSQYLGAF